MIEFFYTLSGKCSKRNKKIGSFVYKCSKLILSLFYPVVAYMNTGYGLNKKSEIIVSLTSFPGRIHTVWITVASLLNQDMKPQKVILWLAEEQFLNKKIPRSLKRLQKRGLEICFCDDLKPHKKYFYTMMNYRENIVITADDDILYPENHIRNLWEGYMDYPNSIVCTWAHTIKLTEKGFSKYNEWENSKENLPDYKIIPIGCNGVLYPPHCLSEDVFDKTKLKELSLYTDDLWLKCMALLNKTKAVKICEYNLIYFNHICTQFDGLWRKNTTGENRNDKVWGDLTKEYSEINEIVKGQNNE